MYVDSFEIEFKSPEGDWFYAGRVYPHYIWRIVRPWYFLGLVRRPRIVNDAEWAAIQAWHTADIAAVSFVHGRPADYGPISCRIWRWERRGWKLRRVLHNLMEWK